MTHKPAVYILVFFIFVMGGCINISGKITQNGAGLEGVEVTLSGPAAMTAITDSKGNYIFPVTGIDHGTYSVTPSLDGYGFDPETREVIFAWNNLTDVDFNGTQPGKRNDQYLSIRCLSQGGLPLWQEQSPENGE